MVKKIKAIALMELMLSAIFLSIIVASTLMLFVACVSLNNSSRDMTAATIHAQCIMEDIKNSDFGNITTRDNNGDWDLSTSDIISPPYNLTALDQETINTTVSSVGNLLEINVRVDWSGVRGRSSNVSLLSYVADYQ